MSAPEPSGAGPGGQTRDLSLRGILGQLAGDVARVDGRLPRTLGTLFRSPGLLARAEIAGGRGEYSSALQLYLVANLVFFLVGPTVGLLNFRLVGFLGIPFYADVVSREIGHLGMSLAVYAVHFDTTVRFRQPTFVFVLVPGLAAVGKAVLPRRLFGEHLILFTDFFAWLLLVTPAVMLVVRLLVGPLSALLGDRAGAALVAGLLVTILGLMVRYLSRSMQGAFGLSGWGAWLRGLAITAGLIALVVVYAHVLFWSTVISLHFG